MLRLLIISLVLAPLCAVAQIPTSPLASQVQKAVWPKLQHQLKDKGLRSGKPIFLRILKEDRLLEIWVSNGKRYTFFKNYPICTFSGGLGTKVREGDGKSPEGFYIIKPAQLNPVSQYHLAINIGYPNKMEMANRYTGNAIMIHGHCASIGCYAMTDPEIDEIYTMVYQAFLSGQKSISLHILPFKMDKGHLQTFAGSPYLALWKNMKQGYEQFERTHIPPNVEVQRNRYVFNNN